MKRKTPLVLMSLFTLLGAKSVTMLNGSTPTPAEDDHLGSAEQALTATLPCCDGFHCQSGTSVARWRPQPLGSVTGRRAEETQV